MKKNKNDFKFVNSNKDDENNKEKLDKIEPIKEETDLLLKKEKKNKIIKNTITFLLISLVSLIFVGIGLLWQWKFNLIGFANAFLISFTLIFFIGWMMFVYNKNILSPLIHGVKTFFFMIVGKKPKDDYYTYLKSIEENPIPKYIIINTFMVSLLLLIVMLILMFLGYYR